MKFTEHYSHRLDERYYTLRHETGVTIYVLPKADFSGAFALFGAKVGSIDDNFRFSGEEEFTKVPAGIAHFLEHKLFENEDCGAFARYAKTGADANAYTSFDKTCYIFSCTDKFDESFEILLDFVQSPYFTEETVQKEQGIIGQEIRMYEDEPSWRVFFNLLLSLYHNHPVRLDIAGTQESIAEITADVLYKCYNSFYHPSNMVIAVAGNVTPEQVYRVADSMLKPVEPKELECRLPDEPRQVVRAFTEQKMDVGLPLFQLGFKDAPEHFDEAAAVQSDILLETIFGAFTPFYRRLFDAGLINNSFGTEYFQLRGAQATIIAGESIDPERVRDEILAEIDRVRREGLSREMFECAHRSIYGSYVRMTQSASRLGRTLASCHFSGQELFALIEAAACVQYDDVVRLLERRLNPVYHALSVVR